ncbi:hypothetical protein D7X33_26585 [Butyricicoccus sp. 1XD8-22]|nr:hypothetical protein D7X33_26585 [Butyricicoccus sp. 1XD8-22]
MNSMGGFIFLFSILFGGYEDVTLKDESVKNNQEAVEDNYYQETRLFNQEVVKFLNTTRPIVTNEDLTDAEREILISITNDFILYLDDFKLTPITDEELNYNEQLNSLIYDLEKYADYSLKYLEKEDGDNKYFVKNHFEKIQQHLMSLSKISQ